MGGGGVEGVVKCYVFSCRLQGTVVSCEADCKVRRSKFIATFEWMSGLLLRQGCCAGSG